MVGLRGWVGGRAHLKGEVGCQGKRMVKGREVVRFSWRRVAWKASGEKRMGARRVVLGLFC